MIGRIEDLEDKLALARAGKDISDSLSGPLARRMIEGESPIRIWREHRGLTQTALAGEIGVGKSYLSQLESGAKTGSVEVWAAAAGALGVTIDDLV